MDKLLERWRRLRWPTAVEVGFEAVGQNLLSRWTEPGRAYHNVEHLRHCLAELDGCPAAEARSPALELALWFHDAICDPRAKDNEEQSAALARRSLEPLGADESLLAEIERLILATKHDAAPSDLAAQLIVDVDLAILGQPAERFDRYEKEIRAEYAWAPWPDYVVGRSRVLERFLERPTIYFTPWFRERHEAAARANLACSLRLLASS